jgi:hypothetical protein
MASAQQAGELPNLLQPMATRARVVMDWLVTSFASRA